MRILYYIILINMIFDASFNVTAEAQVINPTSFQITTYTDRVLEFTISEYITDFYVTYYFFRSCNKPGALYKKNNNGSEYIPYTTVEKIVHPDSFSQTPNAIGVTYNSLGFGDYFINLDYPAEACMSEILIIGNTGQYGIDPCIYLATFPSYNENPSYSENLTYSDNNSNFLVLSPPNCEWIAQTQDEWITISQTDVDTGPGLVDYFVSKNNTRQEREGSINVWQKIFKIKQAAMPPYLPYIPLLMEIHQQ